MARHRPPVPMNRNGWWYYQRAVPVEFKKVVTRRAVVLSLGIRVVDDPDGIRARAEAKKIDDQHFKRWKSLRDGQPELVRYQTAREVSQNIRFDYLEGSQLLNVPVEEFLARVKLLAEGQKTVTPQLLDAVLGRNDGLSL